MPGTNSSETKNQKSTFLPGKSSTAKAYEARL